MGFLKIKSSGMSWEESKASQNKVKYFGILQAANLFNQFKGINKKLDELKWGDEIEYNVGTLDHKNQMAKIHVEGFQKVEDILDDIDQDQFEYQAEFGSWMVEAVPKKPYTLYDVNGPIDALTSLIKRRQLINDEIFMNGLFINSLASFPNIGTKNSFFTENEKLYEIEDYEEHNTVTKSKYILDEMTNPHPRFPTMLSSIRNRRGKKVDIRVPLYPDVNTGKGKIDGELTPGEIHMDAQHFGMG